MQTATIRTDAAAIECFLVPWDSEIFGFPVAQISRFDLDDGADATDALREFEAWCAERDVRLVSCRLDHLRLRESMALEDLGFRFIEMVYEPHLDSLEGLGTPRHPVQVAEATA